MTSGVFLWRDAAAQSSFAQKEMNEDGRGRLTQKWRNCDYDAENAILKSNLLVTSADVQ